MSHELIFTFTTSHQQSCLFHLRSQSCQMFGDYPKTNEHKNRQRCPETFCNMTIIIILNSYSTKGHRYIRHELKPLLLIHQSTSSVIGKPVQKSGNVLTRKMEMSESWFGLDPMDKDGRLHFFLFCHTYNNYVF